MSVRKKAIMMLALPLLLMLLLSGQVLRDATESAKQADQVANVAQRITDVATLAQGMRQEMGSSVMLLLNEDPAMDAELREQLDEIRTRIDAGARPLEVTDFPVDALGEGSKHMVDEAKMLLERLTPIREQVDAGTISIEVVLEEYKHHWRTFTPIPSIMASEVDSAQLSFLLRQIAVDEAYNDAMWDEVIAMLSILSSPEVSPQGLASVMKAVGEARTTRGELELIDRFSADDAAMPTVSEELLNYREKLMAAGAGAPVSDLGFSAADYFGAFQAQEAAMATYEKSVANTLEELARSEADAARDTRNLTLALVVLGVAAGIILPVMISSRLAQRLRKLTHTVETVHGILPKMVRNGRDGEVDSDVELPTIDTSANDEIGHLARAFDAVSDTAVSSIREQSSLRQSISDMYVNIARRDQVLLGRQLAFLYDLEQNEGDQEKLSHLYRLDHLATRMRRNAESLLVLAGIETGRRPRQSMSMQDIVRVASSEIEDYERVESNLENNPRMLGRHALTAAHMMAELIENGCRFSNPGTRVHVNVQVRGEVVIAEIVDTGIGMNPQDLRDANDKITAEGSEYLKTDKLGLYVVGKLGRKLQAPVLVTSEPTVGTTARIEFPVELFDEHSLEDTVDAEEMLEGHGVLAAAGAATRSIGSSISDSGSLMTLSAPQAVGGSMSGNNAGQPPQGGGSGGWATAPQSNGGQLDPSALLGGGEPHNPSGSFPAVPSQQSTPMQSSSTVSSSAQSAGTDAGQGSDLGGGPGNPGTSGMPEEAGGSEQLGSTGSSTIPEPAIMTDAQQSALTDFASTVADTGWSPEFSGMEPVATDQSGAAGDGRGTADDGGWAPQFAEQANATSDSGAAHQGFGEQGFDHQPTADHDAATTSFDHSQIAGLRAGLEGADEGGWAPQFDDAAQGPSDSEQSLDAVSPGAADQQGFDQQGSGQRGDGQQGFGQQWAEQSGDGQQGFDQQGFDQQGFDQQWAEQAADGPQDYGQRDHGQVAAESPRSISPDEALPAFDQPQIAEWQPQSQNFDDGGWAPQFADAVQGADTPYESGASVTSEGRHSDEPAGYERVSFEDASSDPASVEIPGLHQSQIAEWQQASRDSEQGGWQPQFADSSLQNQANSDQAAQNHDAAYDQQAAAERGGPDQAAWTPRFDDSASPTSGQMPQFGSNEAAQQPTAGRDDASWQNPDTLSVPVAQTLDAEQFAASNDAQDIQFAEHPTVNPAELANPDNDVPAPDFSDGWEPQFAPTTGATAAQEYSPAGLSAEDARQQAEAETRAIPVVGHAGSQGAGEFASDRQVDQGPLGPADQHTHEQPVADHGVWDQGASNQGASNQEASHQQGGPSPFVSEPLAQRGAPAPQFGSAAPQGPGQLVGEPPTSATHEGHEQPASPNQWLQSGQDDQTAGQHASFGQDVASAQEHQYADQSQQQSPQQQYADEPHHRQQASPKAWLAGEVPTPTAKTQAVPQADSSAQHDGDEPRMTEAMEDWQNAESSAIAPTHAARQDLRTARTILPSASGKGPGGVERRVKQGKPPKNERRASMLAPQKSESQPEPAAEEKGGFLGRLMGKKKRPSSRGQQETPNAKLPPPPVESLAPTGSTPEQAPQRSPQRDDFAGPAASLPQQAGPHGQPGPQTSEQQSVGQRRPAQQSAAPQPQPQQAQGSVDSVDTGNLPMDMLASDKIAYGGRSGGIGDSLRQRSEVASAALAELSALSTYSPDVSTSAGAGPLAKRQRGATAVPPPAPDSKSGPQRPRDATEVRNMFSGFTAGAARARTGPQNEGEGAD